MVIHFCFYRKSNHLIFSKSFFSAHLGAKDNCPAPIGILANCHNSKPTLSPRVHPSSIHGLTRCSSGIFWGGYFGGPFFTSSEKPMFCSPTITGKWWQIPLAQSAPRNPGKQWHSPDTHSPFPWQLRGQSWTESEKEINSAISFSSACWWSNLIISHPPFLKTSGSNLKCLQGDWLGT